MIDFDAFDALTFDCYGTLIDWETGLLNALRPIVGGEELLEAFAREESRLEAGPYRTYKEVLAGCLRALAPGATDEQQHAFGSSVKDWPAFADCAQALRRLKARYRLGVITN